MVGIFTGLNQAIDANRADKLRQEQLGLQRDQLGQQQEQARLKQQRQLLQDNENLITNIIKTGLSQNKTPEQLRQLVAPILQSAGPAVGPDGALRLENVTNALIQGPTGRQQAISQAQNEAAGLPFNPVAQADLAKTRAQTANALRGPAPSATEQKLRALDKIKFSSPEAKRRAQLEILGVKNAGGGTGLTNSTKTFLQKGVSDGADMLRALDTVSGLTKDEYLTIPAQAGISARKLAERFGKFGGRGQEALDFIGKKLGLPITKEFVAEFSAWEANVMQAFNDYRRIITGAAAAAAELKSLEKAFVNKNMSPTEFRAKLGGLQVKARRALRAKQLMLANGISPQGDVGKLAFESAVDQGDFSLVGGNDESAQASAIDEAWDAISRGADPAAVKQRLEENGFSAEGM